MPPLIAWYLGPMPIPRGAIIWGPCDNIEVLTVSLISFEIRSDIKDLGPDAPFSPEVSPSFFSSAISVSSSSSCMYPPGGGRIPRMNMPLGILMKPMGGRPLKAKGGGARPLNLG